MAPNIKHLLWLVGILVVFLVLNSSISLTASQDSVQLLSSSQLTSALQRGLETEPTANLHREQRNPVREDEFWLIESDRAFLPFDIEFISPDESYGEIEALWKCSDTAGSRTKKLVFVNVVRTEVMEVYELLSSYASSCHAGFASTVMCSGLSWESMKNTFANRRVKGSNNGVRCPLHPDSINRDGKAMKGEKYVQASTLEKSTDIFAGQIPIGSHEQWKDKHENVVDAQYVVSLRCPYAWFISNMIDQVKLQSEGEEADTDSVVAAIKEKVEDDLAADRYHEIYARYLITPSQVSWIQKEEADLGIEHRVELSLANLKNSNALIIISEKKAESLEKLKYLIDRKGEQTEAFDKAKRKMAKDKQSNPAVPEILAALKADEAFYERLKEYLKYEAQIYEQAKDMHLRQLSWLQNRLLQLAKSL